MLTFSLPRSSLSGQWCVPAYAAHRELGKITRLFRTTTVGDAATIRSGTYIENYEAVGSRYLRVDNIREFQLNENPEDLVYVDPTAAKITGRAIVEEHDVLVARTGTLGKASLATGAHTGWVLSQHLTRLTCRQHVLPGFLTCCLNLPMGRGQLISGGFGSTRPELTHDALA